MLPSLFLSHGSPMIALSDGPARRFLTELGGRLPRPRAILVASGHWETERPALSAARRNDTIHDFFGFPQELYSMRYPAPGAPEIAERAAALLRAAGFAPELDRERGLDHGAWVPLLLAYPDHDIPVLQLSIQSWLDPAHHFALGRALGPLRAEDVLVIGSGSFTHNLRRLNRADPHASPPPDVIAFADWMHAALSEGRVDDLLAYQDRAPFAALQHPTEEHLLPLFVALGAGGRDARAERWHTSAAWGTLRMDAYAFG